MQGASPPGSPPIAGIRESGSASAAMRVSKGKASGRPGYQAPWAPSDQYLSKKVHVGPGFEQQTTRRQAVYGKLRSDVPMTKMLLATDWGQGGRDWYDGAADSMHKPLITRPRPGTVGVPFGKQLDRKEAVVGKLLSDVAMTRMLLGANWSQGGENLVADYNTDTFLKPPPTRKRAFLGQHSFSKQIGRVDYHAAGLRGAPAKPGLGERGGAKTAKMQAQMDARAASAPRDRQGGGGGTHGATRPSSAGKLKPGQHGRPAEPFSMTNIPQRPKPHVQVPDLKKQMPRDRWTQLPMRHVG